VLQKIGLIVLTLGSILLGASVIHFGLVTDVKNLPLLKRWLFWLRGGRGFWDGQQSKIDSALENQTGIRPKWRWRTEKTPTIIAGILILIGLLLSL
jgi:hypothetical protein